MKTKEVKKLKPKDFITHQRYGLCQVKEVLWSFNEVLGVCIIPQTKEGINLLAHDSQSKIPTFMEDSIRRINILLREV